MVNRFVGIVMIGVAIVLLIPLATLEPAQAEVIRAHAKQRPVMVRADSKITLGHELIKWIPLGVDF